MKIKKSLFIFLIVFSLVPLYLMTGILTYNRYQSINRITKENLKSIGETTTLNINGFYEARKSELQVISQYAMVGNLMEQSLKQKSEVDAQTQHYVQDMLDQNKLNNPYIISISLINRDFKVVSSTEEFDSDSYSELQNIPEENLSRDFSIGRVVERETEEGKRGLSLPAKPLHGMRK